MAYRKKLEAREIKDLLAEEIEKLKAGKVSPAVVLLPLLVRSLAEIEKLENDVESYMCQLAGEDW